MSVGQVESGKEHGMPGPPMNARSRALGFGL